MTQFSTATFYKHSGAVNAGPMLGATLGGMGLGVVIGAVYGTLGLWAHLFFEGRYLMPVQGVMCFIAAAIVGWGAAALLKAAQVRNVEAAKWAAMAAGAAMLYGAWAFWLYGWNVERQTHAGLARFFAPGTMWGETKLAATMGVWAWGRDINVAPTLLKGFGLWCVWLLEAALVLGLCRLGAGEVIDKFVYCENCRRWGTRRELASVGVTDPAELKKALERGEIGRLGELGAVTPAGKTVIALEGCPDCDTIQTLTVDMTQVSEDAKTKKTSEKKTNVVTRMNLSPEQILTVAGIAAGAKGAGTS